MGGLEFLSAPILAGAGTIILEPVFSCISTGLLCLSKSGFADLARANAANARAAFDRLCKCRGVEPAFATAFFNEFCLKLQRPAAEVLRDLRREGIVGGLDLQRFYPEMKNHLLVCVTELNTREQVEAYAGVLGS